MLLYDDLTKIYENRDKSQIFGANIVLSNAFILSVLFSYLKSKVIVFALFYSIIYMVDKKKTH